MKNRRRFRNYFIEKNFQYRFLRLLIVGAVLQLVLVGGILYYFLQQNYTLLVKYAALDTEIENLLFQELRFMAALIGVLFFSYLCGISALGIIFSHRIAGVMYALKRTMRQLNEGQDVRLHLRTKDEFQDVADDFNRLVDQLKGVSKAGGSSDRKVAG